jgi:transposase-like protein
LRWNSSGAGTRLLGNQAILGALMRSSKYLDNIIEQDHCVIKPGSTPMLGFKRFRRAKVTIAGIELLHRIRKNQFDLSKLQIATKSVSESWNAVLVA